MTSINIITFIKKVINTKEQLNTENDIVNTKLIFEILIESDFQYFYNKLNLTFDQSFGILFTELSESLVMINTYISKSGVSLSFEYDNIKDINIGKLLNKDEYEITKLLNLLVILMLNSSQKDTFIDILLSLDEDIQQDVLNIIEKYIVIDRAERESIKHDFNLSPSKNELKRNKEIEYQVSHLKEEIAYLQKENNDAKLLNEAHEENIKELEKKNVILTLENNDMKAKLSTLKNQENYEKKQSFNNNDTKLIISNLNAEIKELNSIRSQLSSKND